MSLKIALNGFGRIGRIVVRELFNRKADFELVGINDLTDAATLAHLFKYDSVQGKFSGTVTSDENSITINGQKIAISAEKSIENLTWGNVDVVIEATGVFTS
ncbi:MAG: glyceraldehyde 3-phosphate dehydrogenase NAD-binding domain-containing protein, partial [Candidatus Kapaibacteriota bacterium]